MNQPTARIFVHDLAQPERFYKTVLGLKLITGSVQQGFCIFNAGATLLLVEAVASGAPAEQQALVGRFTEFSFTVTNMTDMHRQLVAAGVVFTSAPEKQAWGGTVATFADPSGNQLKLVQLATP